MKEIFTIVRRLVYVSLGRLNDFFGKKKIDLAIFCYHSVASDGWRYSVKPDDFHKQMKYLLMNYRVISMATLYEHLQGNVKITEPSVVITFDDGYKNLLYIKDYLKELNIKPTVFALSDRIHADRLQLNNMLKFLNKREILSLVKASWEVGSHGATHCNFSKLSRNGAIFEIAKSKENLERELGVDISYFSYPKGKYSQNLLFAVQFVGYKLGVSMDSDFISDKTDYMAVPRIGVDGTHTFEEFKCLLTPAVIRFKKLASRFGIEKLII